jgi:NAD(P)-dependent dehydrogenase (short-subunit alcohol dehydrogenase family)
MILKGKVCVIVGAASLRGIGYAAAGLFASQGAIVVAVDLAMNDDVASTIKHSIDEKYGIDSVLVGRKCDISSAAECLGLVDGVISQFGKIDALVNCAGIVQSLSVLSISEADFDRMISVNLKGAFNLAKETLRVMKPQGFGSIVNVASVAAQRGGGLVGGAHYAASKGGVISLTKTIAREFGVDGIRANTVCPSMTETGMIDGMSPEKYQEIVAAIPLQRAGHAEDIAGACLFLASDFSSYITGTTLDVNGGSHIH